MLRKATWIQPTLESIVNTLQLPSVIETATPMVLTERAHPSVPTVVNVWKKPAQIRSKSL